MAVARSGGGLSAVHVWLIVFVVLWLGSTVGLVIMYTDRQKLMDERDNAVKQKRLLATANEESDPMFLEFKRYASSLQPNQPVVRTMLDEIHALAGRITGDTTHTGRDAVARLDKTLEAIRTARIVPSPEQVSPAEGVVGILARLHRWYADQRTALELAESKLKESTTQLTAAQATIQELESKFDSTAGDIKQQVDSLQVAKNEYEASKQAEIDDFSKRLSAEQEAKGQLRQDMASAAQAYTSQLRQRDDIITEQLRKIGDVQGPPPARAQVDSLAREPIGRVMRALPGDSLVHIDLGELDGVTLGMRFAVYSYDRRVEPEGRGKANIEVVGVGPHTAECRVVTPPPPDDPILDDDFIQNIILARSAARKQRFVVLGAFDVDYDGKPDPTGAARIRAYIERFGGEVAEEVDASVDFVVRGRKVEERVGQEGAAVDHAAEPANREARRADQTYEEAIRRAELLGIPRLSQDVFFNFIGLEPGVTVARRLQQ